MDLEFKVFKILFFLKVLYFFQHLSTTYVLFYITLEDFVSLTLRSVRVRLV